MSDAATQHAPSDARETAIVAALGGRSIVLVGMMGVGKSTVGRRLATRLHLPFVDADHEIEVAHAGLTIPEIFAEHGEPYFREGEARVIARLLDGTPGVLATGGGAYMREDTRQRIRDKAVSIWLKAEPDVILRRIRRRADRPLLQTEDPAGTIRRLIEIRYPLYQEADLTVLSRDEPHEKVVSDCVDALYGALCRGDAPAQLEGSQ
jgi:shikimate kinase